MLGMCMGMKQHKLSSKFFKSKCDIFFKKHLKTKEENHLNLTYLIHELFLYALTNYAFSINISCESSVSSNTKVNSANVSFCLKNISLFKVFFKIGKSNECPGQLA